mgnify:CR=1 FL=1
MSDDQGAVEGGDACGAASLVAEVAVLHAQKTRDPLWQVEKEGRIYAFSDQKAYQSWLKTGEPRGSFVVPDAKRS